MSKTISVLPNDDRTNGWSGLLQPRQARLPLRGDRVFDWVVLGGGFAGMAAARRLAQHRPNDSIALLDAGEIGDNASGRNSGFAIDLPHNGHFETDEDIEGAKQSIRVGRYALAQLEGLIREHGIDCQWSRVGKYHAAVTDRVSIEVLDALVHDLDRLDEPYQRLDRRQLAERIGTEHYVDAVYTPGTCLLNPSALCRGLGDSLPSSVTVFENSIVTEFDFEGQKPFVRTHEGSIEYGKLILAVNAFASQFGVFKNKIVPIVLFASLTEQLDDTQLTNLGSSREWGITPAHAVAGSTLRLTQDRRLLIRHGLEYSPNFRCSEDRRGAVKKTHAQLLEKRFPGLAPIEIDHFWMGWLGVSQNHAPAFGKISETVFAASCCNGVGIVRNSAAGMLIADLACGIDNDLIASFTVNGTANRLPPRPILDAGVKAKIWWDTVGGHAEA